MYQTVDGKTAIEVMLSNDTVWLTIDKMAELFQRNKSTISRHIKNILECRELTAESTVAFFATVQKEGKRNVEREIVYYNLDMIISVGYRVNSIRGVQFRMWATSVLREENLSDSLTLTDGTSIPVSRKYRETVSMFLS